ncbi:MAG: helix-turn-helix domain-containing protein [Pirellulaceae bacterium]|nr:helix-turn-helix domain-containing protein [Pirellulaceae bacterium]
MSIHPTASRDIPKLLTIRELAGILKVSPRSIWRLVSSGKIMEPLRVGGSIRWREDAIRDWIDSGCEEIPEKPR